MKEKREKRLNSELKRLIYEILSENRPQTATEMFSVTDVSVTNDLSSADVYISVFGVDNDKCRKTFDALSSLAGEVRRELGRIMHVRRVPELRFKPDSSAAYGERIDEILSGFNYSEDKDDEGNT